MKNLGRVLSRCIHSMRQLCLWNRWCKLNNDRYNVLNRTRLLDSSSMDKQWKKQSILPSLMSSQCSLILLPLDYNQLTSKEVRRSLQTCLLCMKLNMIVGCFQILWYQTSIDSFLLLLRQQLDKGGGQRCTSKSCWCCLHWHTREMMRCQSLTRIRGEDDWE